MATATPMMIRVQANGGKFLADDIGGAEVTVRDARTGRWLDGGRVQGPDSGTLQQSYVPSASRSAIVTPGTPPLVQWMGRDPRPPPPATSASPTHSLLELVEEYGRWAASVRERAVSTPGLSGCDQQGPGFVVELPGHHRPGQTAAH